MSSREPLSQPPRARVDTPSFTELYTQQFGFVWRCLRSLGVDASMVDDAAQEVFVIVHRRLGEFRGESSLRTWLYAIVRNVALNQRRTVRRRGATTELDDTLATHDGDPQERAAEAEAAAFVQAFAARLDDTKRELFVLAFLEEMSMPEVAALLEIPVNTAYTRLRALKLEFTTALRSRGRMDG